MNGKDNLSQAIAVADYLLRAENIVLQKSYYSKIPFRQDSICWIIAMRTIV